MQSRAQRKRSSLRIVDMALPLLTRGDVDACKHSSWYGQFRKHTPKACIIPLEADFVAYLRTDGPWRKQTVAAAYEVCARDLRTRRERPERAGL
jgi:hypothetical protein